MTDLGSLGGTNSEGRGINSLGQITGNSQIAGDTATHAFLYVAGAMVDLGTLGGTNSFGQGINDMGQVVGYSGLAGKPGIHAFLHAGGSMIDLGTLGGANSNASAINASGRITGGSYIGRTTPAGREVGHAFIYFAGTMTDLGTLGGTSSGGQDINSLGQVTGNSDLSGDRAVHAFLYTDGTMVDLGTLGGTGSYSRGMNDRGEVVGHALITGDSGTHAFLYADGSMVDLNAMVTAGLGSATLLSAAAINNIGQILAEGCTSPCDKVQMYRLDPIRGPGTAVEYYHAGYGHYFVTALPQEVAALDAGVFVGWSRTGLSFDVLAVDEAASSNVCRFWSGQTFVTKSSHFYTPFDWECAIVKRNRDWVYEGEVFSMMLPDSAGNCRGGTIPLYRLYNDGQTGAPNHRYSTSLAVRSDMIAQGWIAEGSGIGVIGCVPVHTPTSVTIASPVQSPWVGETVLLTAVARDDSGGVIPGTKVTWSVSNPAVAIISDIGALTALGAGIVDVSATLGGVSGSQTLTITPWPRIGVTVGAKEVVFGYTTDRCYDQDTPDQPARFLRAEDGSLVLIEGNAPRHYISRGADFGSLKRDCTQPALVSANQSTPDSYENQEWLWSVYREGTRLHALIHNEFHDPIAGTCRPGDTSPGNPCWYNSVTYAVSTDGARSFLKPSAPAHVVGPAPNAWVPPPNPVPIGQFAVEGYLSPSNIVRANDGYYYAILTAIPTQNGPARRDCASSVLARSVTPRAGAPGMAMDSTFA